MLTDNGVVFDENQNIYGLVEEQEAEYQISHAGLVPADTHTTENNVNVAHPLHTNQNQNHNDTTKNHKCGNMVDYILLAVIILLLLILLAMKLREY